LSAILVLHSPICVQKCVHEKQKSAGINVPTLFLLVRKMGLEPTRHRHTHLKRACLPIPALPHKAMPWHCKKYFSIPAAKKQGLFGLFFKLLTTVPSRAKIVRYTASFTPFPRIAAKNFNFFQNRACIFAQALIY
jgi:coproporphyrinogen III oxidase